MAYTYPEMKIAKQEKAGTGSNVSFDAACSSTAANSAFINKRGLSHGTVANESGGAVTITYYSASAMGGTALALKDQDGVAVPAQVVGDDECWELPSAIAGCAYLVPKLSSGTATLTFHFER